jgi:hypothetical protein
MVLDLSSTHGAALGPLLHCLIERQFPLSLMRHEVVQLVASVPAVAVSIKRGEQSRSALNVTASIERAAFVDVARPRIELTQGQPFLGLNYRAPSDPIKNQIVPDFVLVA